MTRLPGAGSRQRHPETASTTPSRPIKTRRTSHRTGPA